MFGTGVIIYVLYMQVNNDLTCPPYDAGSLTSKVFHDQQEAYMQQVDLHLLYYKVSPKDSLGSDKSGARIPEEYEYYLFSFLSAKGKLLGLTAQERQILILTSASKSVSELFKQHTSVRALARSLQVPFFCTVTV